MLASCGVDEERTSQRSQQRYDEEFGANDRSERRSNIVDEKEVRAAHARTSSFRSAPSCSDQVETRVIDGMKYILVRADEGVVVNGMNIRV